MPRLPRIHVEGSIYYVTSKAPDEQVIFKEKADYEMYLELLAKYKSEHKFRLYAYCLLPDRLQLLIETGDDATISEIMHDLNSLYTKHFNSRYSRKGPLFESRFRSVLVEKVNHLLQMSRYIHRSPANPQEHTYSSLHLYVAGRDPMGADAKSRGIAEEIREVTTFLENRNDPEAYVRYCLEGDARADEEFEKKLRRASIIGSDEFVERARTRIQEKAESRKEAVRPRARIHPAVLFFIGGMVIAAAGSSVYLYISRADLEKRYELLLQEKEAEFAEKTRFENVSPIALADLRGTEWQIELVARGANDLGSIRDVVRFGDNQVSSEYFASQGFAAAAFELQKSGRRMIWQAVQKNAQGDKLVWRGDWRGDAMKGSVRLEPAFGEASGFSFFSVKWSYSRANSEAVS